MPIEFSLKEAAVIAGVTERAVRKALERGATHPRSVAVGRVPRYRFNVRDLLYLKLATTIKDSLNNNFPK